MGCRVSHEEMLRERMKLTADFGWQVQPRIAQKAVIQQLDFTCPNTLNAIHGTEKSPSPSPSKSPLPMSQYEDLYVTSPMRTNKPMNISPFTVRLSLSSELAPVKVFEPSDSESTIGSQTSTEITDYESSYRTQTSTENTSSTYSSTSGKNNQSVKRSFVTYNPRTPSSASNKFSDSSPSLYSVSRSISDWAPLH